MTDRLADITARIDGIGQLGQVVNAMRGIAAAIGEVLTLLPPPKDAAPEPSRTALVVFCAEQGFVGGFGEAVLRAIEAEATTTPLLVVGTRGLASLAERDIAPLWSAAMPSHTLGIPRLADRIAEAVYGHVVSGDIDALDAVFSLRSPGQPITVQRRRLFPLDPAAFHRASAGNPPLLTLKPEVLLRELTAEYLHAQLCAIALHAFAAENDARMEAMAQAHGQIDRQLGELRAVQRRVRQDEITAEIIELAAGAEVGLRGR